jgi:hypothetical protein
MVCGLGKQRWRETLETMHGDFFGASRIFVLSGSARMSLRPAPIVEKKLELELSVGWGGRARAGKVELELSAGWGGRARAPHRTRVERWRGRWLGRSRSGWEGQA